MTARRTVELVASRELSDTVQSLFFRVVIGADFRYEAGQYVDLYPPSASGLVMRRPYSIASAYDEKPPHDFELAVTRVDEGPTSEALHDLAVGARVHMDGPSGGFTRDASLARSALFIATGTGLAPLRAMLTEDLVRGDDGPRLTLLFGARTERDLLWRAELEALSRRHRRFEYVPTLSRGDAGWSGRRGYVQDHLADLYEPSPDRDVFVCGLPVMVEDVLAILKRAGAPEGTLRFEEYV